MKLDELRARLRTHEPQRPKPEPKRSVLARRADQLVQRVQIAAEAMQSELDGVNYEAAYNELENLYSNALRRASHRGPSLLTSCLRCSVTSLHSALCAPCLLAVIELGKTRRP